VPLRDLTFIASRKEHFNLTTQLNNNATTNYTSRLEGMHPISTR